MKLQRYARLRSQTVSKIVKRFRVYGLGFRVYGFYSEQFISIFVKVNTRDNSLRFLPRALLQSALLFGLFRDLGVKRRERGSGA